MRKWGVHLEAATELLVEVSGEDLHVTGLVHDLRAGIELGVVPRNGLDDLGGAQQRTLLAVQELAEAPVAALDAELQPFLLAPLLDRSPDVHVGVQARAEHLLVLLDRALDIDLGVPWQVGGGVPLTGLGLLVQLAQRRPGQAVIPGEDGIGVVLDDVLDLVGVARGNGQDRVDVVDLGAPDDAVVVVVGDGHE